ncbi:MAG: type II secretion system protein GspL [Thiomicrospira sp.]|jgi:general secretion pathway protein L|nr:type II secretion system protein GspL [Thiomicrospira sp.]
MTRAAEGKEAYFDDAGVLYVPEGVTPSWVWVPTQQLAIHQVVVPGKRRALWLQALPYALEEQLVEPVEQVHLVPMARDEAQQVTLMAVSKARMEAWLASLAEQGLAHLPLVADVFALAAPSEANEWVSAPSLTTPNRCIVRTGEFCGWAVAPTLLPKLLAHAQQRQADVRLCAGLLNRDLSAAELARFNLRQGAYGAQSDSVLWRTWRYPLVMAAVLLSVVFAHTWWQTFQLEQRSALWTQHTEALFKQVFPDVKRIVNLRVQTHTYLQAQQQQAQPSLSALLSRIEPVLLAQSAVQLTRLDWQNAQLQLHVSAQDQQALVRFEQALAQANLSTSLALQSNQPAKGVMYVRAN